MSKFYLLSDELRDKLLEGVCDQCKNCYRGLSQEEFEKVCSECTPVKIIAGLEPADKTVKEFVSLLLDDSRLRIFDYNLIDDLDIVDCVEADDLVVYFGDNREIPDDLLSRKIRCFSVSDEYVNCIHIELEKEK